MIQYLYTKENIGQNQITLGFMLIYVVHLYLIFFGVYYNTRQDAKKELENIFIENPLATVESVF